MKKNILILIGLLLIVLTFIRSFQNFLIVFIILQALNLILLTFAFKNDRPKLDEDNLRKYNKLSGYSLLTSLLISIVIFIIHLFRSQVSDYLIEVLILLILIYSILFTIIVGLSFEKTNRNKQSVVIYLLNAIVLAMIGFSVISLKTNSLVYLLQREIKDLAIYLNLGVFAKTIIDIIVAFNIDFSI